MQELSVINIKYISQDKHTVLFGVFLFLFLLYQAFGRAIY